MRALALKPFCQITVAPSVAVDSTAPGMCEFRVEIEPEHRDGCVESLIELGARAQFVTLRRHERVHLLRGVAGDRIDRVELRNVRIFADDETHAAAPVHAADSQTTTV